jgi:hypothetical protein
LSTTHGKEDHGIDLTHPQLYLDGTMKQKAGMAEKALGIPAAAFKDLW